MNKIKKMDRATCIKMAGEVKAAMAKIAESYGVNVTMGRSVFDDSSATFKVECSVLGENGQVITKEAKSFTTYARLFQLEPEDLFREVFIAGKTLKIVGLKVNSPKFPVLLQDANGVMYKYSATAVQSLLNKRVVA